MKFSSSLLLASAVLCFSACSETSTTETETTTTTESAATETVSADPFASAPTDSAAATPAATPADPNTPVSSGQPDANGKVTFNGPSTVNGAPATASSAGVNPAHGQPGHDCAIPVGAPLGSKPKTQTSTVQTAPAQPNNMQIATEPGMGKVTPVAPPTGAVAAGTNPPHGQPGHDCAIPVGAPLKK